MKPSLFNTEMICAILEDRKTVTRRVVKLKYSNTHLEMFTNKYGTRLIEKQNEEPGVTTIRNPDGTTTHTLLACIEREPPYRPGDILYVKETWTLVPDENNDPLYRLCYKADNEDRPIERWYPSVHMLREDVRIFLRVTDVRVERLQDCGDMEAKEEGCTCCSHFIRVWDSTIKPAERGLYGWEANPWVWVIAFERISKEEAMRNDL